MAGQTRLLLFLVILGLVHADVNVFTQNLTQSLDPQRVVRARLDKLFDILRPRFCKIFPENGLDPLELASFTETIIPLPGSLGARVKFYNGFAHELSNVRRTQHITASYVEKLIVLTMDLGWKNIDFNYEYYYHHLFIKRAGHIFGRFQDLDVKAVVTLDLKNYKISLDQVKFIRVGKFDFKLEGHRLDTIINKLTKVITTVFRRHVLINVEQRVLTVFASVLDRFNKKIPRPKRLQMLQGFELSNL